MKAIGLWLVSLAVCFTAAFMIGCDTDATDSGKVLTLVPSSACLSAATLSTVTFTVSGGDSNYTWTVSNSSLGTLQTLGGEAVYQSVAAAGTNLVTVMDGTGGILSAPVTQL